MIFLHGFSCAYIPFREVLPAHRGRGIGQELTRPARAYQDRRGGSAGGGTNHGRVIEQDRRRGPSTGVKVESEKVTWEGGEVSWRGSPGWRGAACAVAPSGGQEGPFPSNARSVVTFPMW
jgi:GNAT superfamily N-acetyltransferase